eukprot:656694-Rhodomonas_salina.2
MLPLISNPRLRQTTGEEIEGQVWVGAGLRRGSKLDDNDLGVHRCCYSQPPLTFSTPRFQPRGGRRETERSEEGGLSGRDLGRVEDHGVVDLDAEAEGCERGNVG